MYLSICLYLCQFLSSVSYSFLSTDLLFSYASLTETPAPCASVSRVTPPCTGAPSLLYLCLLPGSGFARGTPDLQNDKGGKLGRKGRKKSRESRGGVLLAFSGRRPGMQLNVPQQRPHPPRQHLAWTKIT